MIKDYTKNLPSFKWNKTSVINKYLTAYSNPIYYSKIVVFYFSKSYFKVNAYLVIYVNNKSCMTDYIIYTFILNFIS